MTVVCGMSVGRTAVCGGNPFIWKKWKKKGKKKAVWGRKLLEKRCTFLKDKKSGMKKNDAYG